MKARQFQLFIVLWLSFGCVTLASSPEPGKRLCADLFPDAETLQVLPQPLRSALQDWTTTVTKASSGRDFLQMERLRKPQELTKPLQTLLHVVSQASLSSMQKEILCDSVVPALSVYHLMFDNAALVINVHRALCAASPEALQELLKSASQIVPFAGIFSYMDLVYNERVWRRSAERKQVAKFLRYVISLDSLSAQEWQDWGLEDYFFLALADAVALNWQKLDWDEDAVKVFSLCLLKRGWSLRMVARLMKLPLVRQEQLEPDLDPLQWIQLQHTRGAFGFESLEELQSRIDAFTPEFQLVFNDQYEEPLEKLILDPQIPYELFADVYGRMESQWPKWFGRSLGLESALRFSFFSKKIPAHVVDRVARLVGEDALYPNRVWLRAKAFASEREDHFKHPEPFESARQFIDFFTFNKHYSVPEGEQLTIEQLKRLHAVAEVYFRELRKNLPRFFALNPTAAEMRWLLETPLQFPEELRLHNARVYSIGNAPFWQRPFRKWFGIRKPSDLQTAGDLFFTLEETIRFAMTQVRTLEDWQEIVTFAVPGAFEYEELQRRTMSQFAELTVQLGDPALAWLDRTFFENRQALGFIGPANRLSWFNQLAHLRESVPEALRSERRITAKAVEWILGAELEGKATGILREHANHPLRRLLLEASGEGELEPNPQDIKQANQHLQTGLFKYLTARCRAGATLYLEQKEASDLARLAQARGFVLQQIGNGEFEVKSQEQK